MAHKLTEQEIKEKYQEFKNTDEYKELIKDGLEFRPDLKTKINFLEMTIFEWYVEDRLNQQLGPLKHSYPEVKSYNVVESVDVSKTIEEWNQKYQLKEINDGGFKELGSVELKNVKDLDFNNLNIKEIFPDTPDNKILYHNKLISSTNDVC